MVIRHEMLLKRQDHNRFARATQAGNRGDAGMEPAEFLVQLTVRHVVSDGEFEPRRR